MKQTIQQFFKQFPDERACLAHLFKAQYGNDYVCPQCKKPGKWYPLTNRRAYSCQWCGHHEYPCVGTPFHRSRTRLQLWFYAIFLFTKSRHGVPAKELERQLGVTYKCAWRMAHEIRKHMTTVDGDPPLGGHVEADETYIGGRRAGGKRGRGAPGKTVVFGMVERGGDVMTRVVPNVRKATLERHILENIKGGATVSTDELKSYAKIARLGYDHGTVNHSADQWVDGIHHVNSMEGFWSQLKRSIRGTHIHVSRKHLSKYLGEFEYRYNSRRNPEKMLPELLSTFPTSEQE